MEKVINAPHAQAEEISFNRYKEFGIATRFLHWLRAISIFILIGTGFYIAFPFLQPNPSPEPTVFLQGYIRSSHIIFGFALICASIFRVYSFIFARASAPERSSFSQIFSIKKWIGTIGSYLFVSKHPHIEGAYNPLQFVVYFSLAVLTLVVSVTGVALYCNVYHSGLGGFLAPYFKWVEVVSGGLSNVRNIHHIATWCFILFIPVHVYMVIWNSIKYPNGGADAMVSGFRYMNDRKV